MTTRVRWWIGAVAMFGGMATLIIDAGLFAMLGGEATVSAWVADYVHLHPLHASLFGFVTGGLLVHFTGWAARPPGGK